MILLFCRVRARDRAERDAELGAGFNGVLDRTASNGPGNATDKGVLPRGADEIHNADDIDSIVAAVVSGEECVGGEVFPSHVGDFRGSGVLSMVRAFLYRLMRDAGMTAS